MYCFAECRYDECRFAECHYIDCPYAQCRGSGMPLNTSVKLFIELARDKIILRYPAQ
jgi:hypothetical protein